MENAAAFFKTDRPVKTRALRGRGRAASKSMPTLRRVRIGVDEQRHARLARQLQEFQAG